MCTSRARPPRAPGAEGMVGGALAALCPPLGGSPENEPGFAVRADVAFLAIELVLIGLLLANLYTSTASHAAAAALIVSGPYALGVLGCDVGLGIRRPARAARCSSSATRFRTPSCRHSWCWLAASRCAGSWSTPGRRATSCTPPGGGGGGWRRPIGPRQFTADYLPDEGEPMKQLRIPVRSPSRSPSLGAHSHRRPPRPPRNRRIPQFCTNCHQAARAAAGHLSRTSPSSRNRSS